MHMKISDSDKAYLLSLKPEDLTFSTLLSLLGDRVTDDNPDIQKETHARFKCTDTFELSPQEYFVSGKVTTTVGRFIYNKYIIERCGFQKVTGYINEPITNGINNKIEAKLSTALLDDVITVAAFKKYIDYRDTLGLQMASVVTTSFTERSMFTPKPIVKKRDELFKKYKAELDAGDVYTAEKIEKELTKDAKEYLKGDPGIDLYQSEARGNFGNYKNMFIMRGASHNLQEDKFEIVKSSFFDGIKKEDIAPFGNMIVSGQYPKSVFFPPENFQGLGKLAAYSSN